MKNKIIYINIYHVCIIAYKWGIYLLLRKNTMENTTTPHMEVQSLLMQIFGKIKLYTKLLPIC